MRDTLSFAWLSITRHRLRSLLAMAGVAVGVCAASGCGHRAAHKPAPTPAVPKVAVPLPEWTPKNPSPEFLRAARVLKPMPPELAQNNYPTLPSVWEFFGTLSDDQVQEFMRVKETRFSRRQFSEPDIKYRKEHMGAKEVGDELVIMRRSIILPVPKLMLKQRKALDRVFAAWAKWQKGKPMEDLLVTLYKIGAKQDLSNVDVGFDSWGGHVVSLMFYVTLPDGSGSGGGIQNVACI